MATTGMGSFARRASRSTMPYSCGARARSTICARYMRNTILSLNQ